MYIPLAGPWITMATSHAQGGDLAGLVVLGIGQAAGAGMLIAGLASRSEKLVRNVGGLPVTIAPIVRGGRAGLSIIGAL